MFLGKKRKFRVKKYAVPSELEKVSSTTFYNTFLTFKTAAFPSTITSMTTPPFSSPGSPSSMVFSYRDSIELRQYKEDSVAVTMYTEAQSQFYSLTYREDGEVIACGSDVSKMYIFPARDSIKKPLRVLNLQSNSNRHDSMVIRYCSFLNPLSLIGGTETGEVIVRHILREKTLLKDDGVGDSIRCGIALNHNEFVIGSYNRKVRFYDIRTSSSSAVGNYEGEAPLEWMCCMGEGHNEKEFLTVEKRIIKWLDMRRLAGPTANMAGPVVHRWAAIHRKAVTGIQPIPTKRNYFLTSSLDETAKVLKLSRKSNGMGVKRIFRFSDPLYFGRFNPSVEYLFFANSQRNVLVSRSETEGLRDRRRQDKIIKMYKDERDLVKRNFQVMINFDLLQQTHELKNRILTRERRSEYTSKYAKLFKEFQFKEILQIAIKEEKDPIAVVSIIEELKTRNELINAIDNRDEDELGVILTFIYKNMDDDRFLQTLIQLFNIILFYYASVIGKSKKVDRMIRLIRVRVNEILLRLTEMKKLRGMIDMMLIHNIREQSGKE